MTFPNFRRGLLALTLAAGFAAGFGTTPSYAGPNRDVSPFCIKTGSAGGADGAPLQCGFYNYQTCLEVAAPLHGNCVANQDFRGHYVRSQNTWVPVQ